jgi:nitroreductase
VPERIDLLDAIRTNRSIRRFRPDPIPDEVVAALIEAATRAPSGGNSQRWRFLAVRDPELRRRVGDLYRQAWGEYSPPGRLAAIADPRERRRVENAIYLSEHMGTEPPLLILVCAERAASPLPSEARARMELRTAGASVYPAVQNLLLAARAYGLGGCLTTIHLFREAEVKAVLGIPETVDSYALVPIGRPLDPFGPLRRRPVAEVAFLDRWGAPLPTTAG